MIEVTLVYPSGKSFFAGQFKEVKEADAWIEKVKSEPSFEVGTQIQINDRTAEYAAQEAAALVKFEADVIEAKAKQVKDEGLRLELVELKKSKPKFGKELDEILDKILELVAPG
jgi:hypothetical protein